MRMRIHFDKLKFIYPGLNQAGGVEIIGTNDNDDSLSFYLDMKTAVEFSKELSDFVKEWEPRILKRRKPRPIVVNAPPVCRKCLRCHRGDCRRTSDSGRMK